MILYFSPAGMLVLAPLPDDIHGIVATLDPAPEQPTMRDAQTLLDARGARHRPAVVQNIVWGSRFRVHHTGSPTPTAPAASFSPATRPTSTARRAVRA